MDLEPTLHYQLHSLTADPIPSAQLDLQETRIQTSVHPNRK